MYPVRDSWAADKVALAGRCKEHAVVEGLTGSVNIPNAYPKDGRMVVQADYEQRSCHYHQRQVIDTDAMDLGGNEG